MRPFCSTYGGAITGVRVNEDSFIVVTAAVPGDDVIDVTITVGPDGTCACKVSNTDGDRASAVPDVRAFARILGGLPAEVACTPAPATTGVDESSPTPGPRLAGAQGLAVTLRVTVDGRVLQNAPSEPNGPTLAGRRHAVEFSSPLCLPDAVLSAGAAAMLRATDSSFRRTPGESRGVDGRLSSWLRAEFLILWPPSHSEPRERGLPPFPTDP